MKSLVKREYNSQGILIKKQCTECKRMLPVEEYQKASKVKQIVITLCMCIIGAFLVLMIKIMI